MSLSVRRRLASPWIVWGILFLPYLMANFHRLAMGVAREALSVEFALQSATFANIGAAYFYAYALLQIPSGMLADSIGPRRTVSIGTAVAGAGSIGFGFAGSAAALFFARLIVGIGVSVLFLAILKAISARFPEDRFSSMTGLTAGLGTLGGVFAQTPLHLSIHQFGWRSTFIGVGAGSMLLALFIWSTIRDSSSPHLRENPPDTENVRLNSASAEPVSPPPSVIQSLVAALRNVRSWPPFFVFFGAYGAFIALSGSWGQAYAVVVLGVNETVASNLLIATVVGITAGGILSTKISDRLHRRRKPMIALAVTGLFAWVFFVGVVDAGTPRGALYVIFFVLGFCSGVSMNTPACAKEVNHPSHAGVATSVANVGGFVGAALIPLIMATILDATSQLFAIETAYRIVFMVCIGAYAIVIAGSLMITETGARNIYESLRVKAERRAEPNTGA